MKKSVMALLLLLGSLGAWAAGPVLEVWKSPYCGCCGKWVEHMQKAGFVAKVHEVQDVSAQRKALGIPDSLGSCHTAKVGGYVLEGHVPAQDVQRLLREKLKAVGLAVPGMPPASPGMDLPMTGDRSYETLLVQSDGKTRRFALHE